MMIAIETTPTFVRILLNSLINDSNPTNHGFHLSLSMDPLMSVHGGYLPAGCVKITSKGISLGPKV
jgi:hypothetical protein